MKRMVMAAAFAASLAALAGYVVLDSVASPVSPVAGRVVAVEKTQPTNTVALAASLGRTDRPALALMAASTHMATNAAFTANWTWVAPGDVVVGGTAFPGTPSNYTARVRAWVEY